MTQLEKARSGKTTEAMLQISAYEGIQVEDIREMIGNGQIIVPQNIHHHFTAKGIGKNLKTKVNANIGTSPSHADLNEELEKLDIAVQAGADAVMDLSTGGDLDLILREILNHSPVMVGTVPIYKSVSRLLSEGKSGPELSVDDIFYEIEHQAKNGAKNINRPCENLLNGYKKDVWRRRHGFICRNIFYIFCRSRMGRVRCVRPFLRLL